MYNLLTTTKLTTLQSMLFEGIEAYRAADLKRDDPEWMGTIARFTVRRRTCS